MMSVYDSTRIDEHTDNYLKYFKRTTFKISPFEQIYLSNKIKHVTFSL